LAGTSWGQQKKTLLLTYQALSRSVIDYAAPVWAPVVNDTTWRYLQTAQNEALRIATGCHKMSHADHLQGGPKKSKPDNFYNNFVKCQPIFIIFGMYTL